MGLWIAVIVIAGVLAGAAVGLALRSRRRVRPGSADTADEPVRRPSPPPPPMNDLESALSRVTDRDGRPIRERIDAEAAHVDPLRDPNDTGPLLRRALDSITHHDDGQATTDERPSDA